MLTKFKTKLSNMTMKNWIEAGLWILTFILLITFVILAAVVDKGNKTVYANVMAASGTAFVLSLFAALWTTVMFAYYRRKGGQ